MRTRQVTESRVLAAMSHPLRRRILDVLKVYGPSTVSSIAARTDQAGANASHHLRVLADSGLIEPAPECGTDQRERWWKRAQESVRWSAQDFDDDPAAAVIASAATSLGLDRQVGLARRWHEAPTEARERWRQAAFSSDTWLNLSPAELAELSEKVIDLVHAYGNRLGPDGDGDEREPVFFFTNAFPSTP